MKAVHQGEVISVHVSSVHVSLREEVEKKTPDIQIRY